MDKVERGH